MSTTVPALPARPQFNVSHDTLGDRIRTGLKLIAAVAITVLYAPIAFIGILTAAAASASTELHGLLTFRLPNAAVSRRPWRRRSLAIAIVGAACILPGLAWTWCWPAAGYFDLLARGTRAKRPPWMITTLSAWSMAGPLALVAAMLRAPGGKHLVLALAIYVAGSDIAGIAFGRGLGWIPGLSFKPMRHISPKKSLIGFVGALSTPALAGHYLAVQLLPLDQTTCTVLGLAIGILGQTGDIGASVLKRQEEWKDYDTCLFGWRFLPGMGGIWDRLDSVFLTAPLFYGVLVINGAIPVWWPF